MKYCEWRQAIFGQHPNNDPVMLDLPDDVYDLPQITTIDFIDQALADVAIHQNYSPAQIGIGLNLIYSNACSDIPFCYIELSNSARRIQAIANLKLLYTNFFDRYCTWKVESIGNDLGPHELDRIGFLCYMLWDIFVLNSLEKNIRAVSAVLEVLAFGIGSKNDNSIVSAVHGLGHWVHDAPKAKAIIDAWLKKPSTTNTAVIAYAKQAATGYIL